MATQEMQLQQTGTGAARRIAITALVVTSLGVGALIGRSTSPTTRTDTAVRLATPISLTGWDTTDAARRAQVYEAVTAEASTLAATGPSMTDAQRRAFIYEIVTGG